MAWNKFILAAAITALLGAHHARAEAPTADREVTDAERAKLEAASEAAPPPPAAVATPPAISTSGTAATTRSSGDSSRASAQPYRSYGASSSYGSDNGVMVLPSSYYSLMSRSIFIKGSQEVIDRFGNGRNSYASNSGNNRSSSYATTQAALMRPETSLIFDGATHADGRFTALIEDSGSHAITPVSPGDRLARGTVTALTLNSLDYTASGRTVHVGVGQNLDGVDAAHDGTATGSSGGLPSASPSSASPSSGTSGTTAAPAGADDVLEKLRKRRQQELSGK